MQSCSRHAMGPASSLNSLKVSRTSSTRQTREKKEDEVVDDVQVTDLASLGTSNVHLSGSLD